MHSSFKTVLFTLLTITVLALVLGSNEPVKAEGEKVVNVKAKDKTEAVSKDESEVTQSDSEGDAGTKEDVAETEKGEKVERLDKEYDYDRDKGIMIALLERIYGKRK